MRTRKAFLKFFKSGVPVTLVLIIIAALLVYEIWSEDREVLNAIKQEQEGLTENRVVYASVDDEVVLGELRKKALQSYPSAKRRFLNNEVQIFYVRTVFKDQSGLNKNGYLRVNRIEDGNIYAAHVYRAGAEIRSVPMIIRESEILDWLIYSSNGIEEGNLSGKYLLEKAKKQL